MMVHCREVHPGVFYLNASIDIHGDHSEYDTTYQDGYLVPNWMLNPFLSLDLFVIRDQSCKLTITAFPHNENEPVTKEYTVDFDNYRAKTHELINWMNDQMNRVVTVDEMYSSDFFPEL